MNISLNRRKGNTPISTKIDKEDYVKIKEYRWWVSNGYVCTNVTNGSYHWKGNGLLMHRLLMNAPKGMVVDHINGDRLDNRKSNLRVCTVRENVINAKLSKNNSSGFRGVSFRKDRNKYRAYIMVNRKQIPLGNYTKFKDAVKARTFAEQEYFGEFAPSN